MARRKAKPAPKTARRRPRREGRGPAIADAVDEQLEELPPGRKREPREGEGRPQHAPTELLRTKVMLAAVLGRPHHEIATLIGTGTRQLLREYSKELEFGKTDCNVKMMGALFRTGMRGNFPAQRFWLVTQAGLRDSMNLQHSSPSGGPVEHAVVSSDISDADAMRAYLQMVKGE